MNNRLGDIPKWALEDSDDDDDAANGDDDHNIPKNNESGGDIEMQQQQQNNKTTDYMEDFFRHVDSIKADIDAVTKASKDIANISEQSMRATTTAEENKLSKKLKPLIDSTNKRAKGCKNLLGLLKEDTTSLKGQGKLNVSDIRYVQQQQLLLLLLLLLCS